MPSKLSKNTVSSRGSRFSWKGDGAASPAGVADRQDGDWNEVVGQFVGLAQGGWVEIADPRSAEAELRASSIICVVTMDASTSPMSQLSNERFQLASRS